MNQQFFPFLGFITHCTAELRPSDEHASLTPPQEIPRARPLPAPRSSPVRAPFSGSSPRIEDPASAFRTSLGEAGEAGVFTCGNRKKKELWEGEGR